MKLLRVVCEAARGAEVVRMLDDMDGVAHVTRFRGVATEPDGGDVVEATVDRGVLDAALGDLRSAGITHTGGISVLPISLVVSDTAERAQEEIPGDPDDALVWDELVATTGEDGELSVEYVAFLTIACMLAAAGVVTGSAVTIVGAMVVSPDFGPLAAMIVGAVGRRRGMALRGVAALVGGYAIAVAATVVLAVVLRALDLVQLEDILATGGVSFVYQPGPYSVIVALLAGAAGMLALTSSRSGVLIGVFISLTTVPAAGYAALAIVFGQGARLVEALTQLGLNVLGVLVAGTVVLWVRRATVRRVVRRPAPVTTA